MDTPQQHLSGNNCVLLRKGWRISKENQLTSKARSYHENSHSVYGLHRKYPPNDLCWRLAFQAGGALEWQLDRECIHWWVHCCVSDRELGPSWRKQLTEGYFLYPGPWCLLVATRWAASLSPASPTTMFCPTSRQRSQPNTDWQLWGSDPCQTSVLLKLFLPGLLWHSDETQHHVWRPFENYYFPGMSLQDMRDIE